MDYNKKYLKYKLKYIKLKNLELQNQTGGGNVEELLKKKKLSTRELNV